MAVFLLEGLFDRFGGMLRRHKTGSALFPLLYKDPSRGTSVCVHGAIRLEWPDQCSGGGKLCCELWNATDRVSYLERNRAPAAYHLAFLPFSHFLVPEWVPEGERGRDAAGKCHVWHNLCSNTNVVKNEKD
jgi:hypothetical protein